MDTHFDRLIDQFESELKSGTSPEIESYLQQVPEESRELLLTELISLEVFYRLKLGAPVAAADYVRFGGAAVAHAEQAILKDRAAETEAPSGSDAANGIGGRQASRGERIGPYKLVQQLGEGGMGTVWLAEQEQPVKRLVALKLIKAELASKDVIARFEAERQALAMMEHQHIAKVLDAGATEGGSPYFVMELVKGVPFTQYCDTNKLSVDDRLRLFIPVCKAVQHAHQKGIIHRDLKPSNVLVTVAEGEAVPKVIDFGLAKATEHTLKLTDKTMFTEFGNIVGTLQYMSPEQAETHTLDIDTRTDIYSLGVMLYELLTGSTPLDKETLGKNALLRVLEIIREKDPPRPSHRLSSSSGEASSKISDQRRISSSKLQQVLRGDLDWVVMKALDKDRTRRYQTASDLAQDISNYLTGDAVEARPPSAAYRFRKFVRKNKVPVGIVAGLFALVTGSAITVAFALANANVARAEAEASAARSEKILAIVGDSFDAPNPESGATADMSAKDVLLKAKESLDSSDLDDLGKIHLLNQLCSSFRGLGNFDLAVQVAEEWRELSAATWGPDHPDTLAAMSTLATGYSEAGRLKEAAELIAKTFELQKIQLGKDHPDTLASMRSLVINFYRNGHVDEAIKLNEEALRLTEAKLGPDHEDTINSMGNLAVGYRMAGRIDESIGLMAQTLELFKSKLGPDHPRTLNAMGMLALSYHNAERNDEAIELEKKSIRLKEAKLGVHHPQTLRSLGNLAIYYSFAGRLEESLELKTQTVERIKAKLGPEHPDTLAAMAGLASGYSTAQRFDEAIELRERILQLRKETLGLAHPDTLGSMRELSYSYRDAGRADEEIKLLEESIQAVRTNLGTDHPEAFKSMSDLALSYRKAGRLEEAIELNSETLRLRKAHLGPDHPDTISSMNNLAIAYRFAGQFDEAIALNGETIRLKKTVLGPVHSKTLRSMAALGNAYRDAGRTKEAIELLTETLQLQKTNLGAEHSDTLRTMNDLAIGYRKAGLAQRSLELRQQRLELLRSKHRANHPDAIKAMTSMMLMLVEYPDLIASLDDVVKDLKQHSLSTPDAKVFRALALADFRSGEYEGALSSAESSIKTSSDSVRPMNLALLSMSHFKLGNAEKAIEYRDQFVEAMKSEEFKEDSNCLLLADELQALVASEAAALDGQR